MNLDKIYVYTFFNYSLIVNLQLQIENNLNKMIKDNNVKELILAMNYSVESDVTAHVISEMISQSDISVTRIAQGIPIGSDLNYIDSNTLATAFEKRTKY